MKARNASVDGYLRKHKEWGHVLGPLREILVGSPLSETVKWRAPCYTFEGRNVVLLGAFKESCVVSFLKGALLKDSHGLLAPPGPNSQAVRVMRFGSVEEVTAAAPLLPGYIREAIAIEKAGVKAPRQKAGDWAIPAEFEEQLARSPALKAAFAALTPGRQRAYLLHFAGAKQSETRSARIARHAARILAGKGLDD